MPPHSREENRIAEGHESRTGYVRMVASASQAAETLIASLSLKEHPAV